jgi:hypothetical protein
VARVYAGILGPLAFLTILARGVWHAGPAEGTLLAAWQGMWVFAALGGVAGWIAQRTVDESVRARVARQLSGQADAPANA